MEGGIGGGSAQLGCSPGETSVVVVPGGDRIAHYLFIFVEWNSAPKKLLLLRLVSYSPQSALEMFPRSMSMMIILSMQIPLSF